MIGGVILAKKGFRNRLLSPTINAAIYADTFYKQKKPSLSWVDVLNSFIYQAY